MDHAPDPFGLTARSHPLRASLSEEMHVRKLPPFAAPARLVQIVTLMGESGTEASRAHVAALCERHGLAFPANVKYFVAALGGVHFVWERHTEFATYSFIAAGDPAPDFGPGPFVDTLAEWLADLPGEVIRATRIALVDAAHAPSPAFLRAHFAADDLVVCDMVEGRARLWSDFRLHDDGFGRLLLADMGLAGDEPAQLVQRLQELGNYRNMALLGLPVAQRLAPEVSRLERRLAALTAAVSERRSEDEALLDELSFLSAELARLSAETRYRMSASRAYAELSHDRLRAVGDRAVRGYQTLGDFTERRLVPAMRTCDSFSLRLEDLSQRIAWTSSLLRTRVDTALARQNRDLLEAMNRRAKVQLRLQQTVEGLSVVAISYYALGLLGYVVKALHGVWPAIGVELAVGACVPPVLLAVAVALRRVHRGADGV